MSHNILIMKKTSFAIITFCLFISGITLQAQNTIAATGGNSSGSGGTVSHTVGQVVYTTNTGASGTVTQGVQQPFEISIVSGLEDEKQINLICSAYPNPASDLLTLKVENYDTDNLSYKIYDDRGKLLESRKVESFETIISMANLIPSIYFLKVLDGNKEVKIFKIIKN